MTPSRLWVLVLLLLAQPGQAQPYSSVTRLRQQVATARTNPLRCRLSYDLGVAYAQGNADSSLYFLHQSLRLARQQPDSVAMTRATARLAWTYLHVLRDEASVVRWANQTIAVAKARTDHDYLAEGFRLLAVVSTHQRIGSPDELYATAIAHAQKSDNWAVRDAVYGTYMEYQISNKRYAEAETWVVRCMAEARSHNIDLWFTNGLDYWMILEAQGKHAQATALARQLALVRPQLRKLEGEFVYINDQAQLALILNDYPGAETILREGIAREQQRAHPDTMHLFYYYRTLANTYSKQGAWQKAYQTANNLADARLWVQRVRQTRDSKLQIIEAKSALDLERKEKEIVRLAARQQQQVLLLIGAVVTAGLLLSFVLVQRRTQQRIERQRAELSQLNATKDKLFAILSHDLRAPIIGLKNILTISSLGDMTPAEFAQSSANLSQQSTTLLTLLDNALNWAQAQMGGWRTIWQRVELAPLVAEQVELIRPAAAHKHIRIEQDIPPGAVLRADENQLAIILRNLLQNAVKYTAAGGLISVRYAPASRTIEVQDNGIGMDKAALDALFRAVPPSSRPGTAGEPGTGLGLLLVKQLTEANNGQMTAESRPNHGSLVRLTFR